MKRKYFQVHTFIKYYINKRFFRVLYLFFVFYKRFNFFQPMQPLVYVIAAPLGVAYPRLINAALERFWYFFRHFSPPHRTHYIRRVCLVLLT